MPIFSGGKFTGTGTGGGDSPSVGAFGEGLVAEPTASFQCEFSQGNINSQQFVQFTALNGSISCTAPLASVSTGTTVGGTASLQTRRALRYKPGQGAVTRYTAKFTAGVASSIQIAGPFTGGDGMAFGYDGTTFGVLIRRGGLREVQKLTITTASSTSQNVTVALAGVNYSIAVTNSGNKGTTAAEIAAGNYDSGLWQAYSVHPAAADPYVIFVQRAVGDKTGSYSLTAATAVGSFSTLCEGVAVTDTWIPQTSWNRDKMNGSGPSGRTLDPTKLNVYQVQYQYLGAGAILWQIEDTITGRFITVHQLEYAGTATTTHIANPNLRLSFVAGSLGSTTDLSVSTASVGAFTQGKVRRLGPTICARGNKTGVGATMTPILSIRNPLSYNNRANFSESFIHVATAACDGTKPTRFVIVYNPTLTGARFVDIAGDTSSALQEDTSATAYTGGREWFSFTVAKSGNEHIDFQDLEFLLAPGDTVMLAASTASGTTDIDASFTVSEEL